MLRQLRTFRLRGVPSRPAQYLSSSPIIQGNSDSLIPPAPPLPDVPSPPVGDVLSVETIAELGYYPSDLFSRGLENIHLLTGIPYWQAIIVATVALRLVLLPPSIMGQRVTSRLAAVRPEIDKMVKRGEKDPANKPLYDQEIAHLYKKYQVNPLAAFVNPLIQFPLFLSAFFGIKQMGTYFPEFSSGGVLWFSDLTAADPTYALPIASAVTFLALTEFGTDQMQLQNYPYFKPMMRVMGVGVVPLTYFLPSGVFLYWCTNNVISLAQTLALRDPSIGKSFGILPPPLDAPAIKITGNPFKKFFNALWNNNKDTVEFIDGKSQRVDIPITFNPQKKREMAAAAAAAAAAASDTSVIDATTTATKPKIPSPVLNTSSNEPLKTFTAPPKVKKSKPRL